MHSGVMAPLATQLAQTYRVHLIDLPGHGLSECPKPASNDPLSDWAEAIMNAIDRQTGQSSRCYWVGWSLGGRLAQYLCGLHPERCQGLATITSNPQFVNSPEWPHGMPANEFNAFQKAILDAPQRALNRFIQLITSGNERRLIREVKRLHASRPLACDQALFEGLVLLNKLSLAPPMDAPWLALFAHDDKLIPSSAATAMHKQAHVLTLPTGGHCGWLEHPQDLAGQIMQFFNDYASKSP